MIETATGEKMTFTQVTNAAGQVIHWTPDDQHPGFTLARSITSGISTYTLTDPSGNVATFVSEAAQSPNAKLTSFQQAGSSSNYTYTYTSVGTRQRLSKVTAPYPSTGCRARSRSAGQTSAPQRLRGHRDPGAGRDQHASGDPRLRLLQRRERASDQPQRSATERLFSRELSLQHGGPARSDLVCGQAAWTLGYTTISGDAGSRLSTVSRPNPDGGTATTSVRYGISPSSPYNMSTTETHKWGQDEICRGMRSRSSRRTSRRSAARPRTWTGPRSTTSTSKTGSSTSPARRRPRPVLRRSRPSGTTPTPTSSKTSPRRAARTR